MNLKQAPELLAFFSQHLYDGDPELDAETARSFASSAPFERVRSIASQARALAEASDLPLEELGAESNRWFATSSEASAWLQSLATSLEAASSGAENQGESVVKDSNGAPLAEGDTVQVIKDLKVKGGSSDLKRGTVIKKIHLIGDPDLIECRVDGSTLVLKTCFLKKA